MPIILSNNFIFNENSVKLYKLIKPKISWKEYSKLALVILVGIVENILQGYCVGLILKSGFGNLVENIFLTIAIDECLTEGIVSLVSRALATNIVYDLKNYVNSIFIEKAKLNNGRIVMGQDGCTITKYEASISKMISNFMEGYVAVIRGLLLGFTNLYQFSSLLYNVNRLSYGMSLLPPTLIFLSVVTGIMFSLFLLKQADLILEEEAKNSKIAEEGLEKAEQEDLYQSNIRPVKTMNTNLKTNITQFLQNKSIADGWTFFIIQSLKKISPLIKLILLICAHTAYKMSGLTLLDSQYRQVIKYICGIGNGIATTVKDSLVIRCVNEEADTLVNALNKMEVFEKQFTECRKQGNVLATIAFIENTIKNEKKPHSYIAFCREIASDLNNINIFTYLNDNNLIYQYITQETSRPKYIEKQHLQTIADALDTGIEKVQADYKVFKIVEHPYSESLGDNIFSHDTTVAKFIGDLKAQEIKYSEDFIKLVASIVDCHIKENYLMYSMIKNLSYNEEISLLDRLPIILTKNTILTISGGVGVGKSVLLAFLKATHVCAETDYTYINDDTIVWQPNQTWPGLPNHDKYLQHFIDITKLDNVDTCSPDAIIKQKLQLITHAFSLLNFNLKDTQALQLNSDVQEDCQRLNSLMNTLFKREKSPLLYKTSAYSFLEVILKKPRILIIEGNNKYMPMNHALVYLATHGTSVVKIENRLPATRRLDSYDDDTVLSDDNDHHMSDQGKTSVKMIELNLNLFSPSDLDGRDYTMSTPIHRQSK